MELDDWRDQVMIEINAKMESELQNMKTINEDNQKHFASIETKLVDANVENQALKTEIEALKIGR